MSWSMEKYKESLARMLKPIPLSQYPQIALNLCGLMQYAQEKGVKVIDLSEEEKAAFIQK